ncbi:hypothetical protein ID144_14265 [Pseudomonas sp. JM0905a]|uniref:Uncharacterized protein n=1 Tax=Metapseudomonas resinovorans TaxID=53412 RepID=A0ABT4Y0D5_METRE|nr:MULTISPECIES: hypothetical protein [Pseudomonas]MBD2838212.1 hypothetical protein [Pseudomonas sp. JM0905a]MDA8482295.1 hypothetical protein [Pseudomonas resinovorans]
MRLALLTLLLTLVAPSFAAPAPFFIWQSKLDGALTCAQTTPGEGWQRLGGPFRDAGCRVPY